MDLDDDEENISSSSRGSNGTGSGNGSGSSNNKNNSNRLVIRPSSSSSSLSNNNNSSSKLQRLSNSSHHHALPGKSLPGHFKPIHSLNGLPTTTSNSSTSLNSLSSNSLSGSSGPKFGRSYYTSPFNPTSPNPITIGSEVAYKAKGTMDWIQCIVTRVITETKFEIKDADPDSDGQDQFFIANYKDIILIPPAATGSSSDIKLKNYPIGYKVLAKYPETTAFYPAEVISGNKKFCRLKFEGEEEVGKETEVERRLVLPYPK
ncbi:unnamed protein product [Ambrosiozyma monospora]|uniref:Unnamed protein product n=1 Tax=Ambrosiozyma monospora TaxID=43982 RepID=A0ACB5TBS9_AMBMO|nr:unnamed protein product [Ambrosiozyma monospora]